MIHSGCMSVLKEFLFLGKLYGRDSSLFVVFLVLVDCGLPISFVS
jgi:hypothetical protein